MEFPNRVQHEARDTFVVDGPQDLVQRVLFSLEGFLPDGSWRGMRAVRRSSGAQEQDEDRSDPDGHSSPHPRPRGEFSPLYGASTNATAAEASYWLWRPHPFVADAAT